MYELFHAHQCRFRLFVCLHCVPYSGDGVCVCVYTRLRLLRSICPCVLCERAFVCNSTDGNYVALVMHRHTFFFFFFFIRLTDSMCDGLKSRCFDWYSFDMIVFFFLIWFITFPFFLLLSFVRCCVCMRVSSLLTRKKKTTADIESSPQKWLESVMIF